MAPRAYVHDPYSWPTLTHPGGAEVPPLAPHQSVPPTQLYFTMRRWCQPGGRVCGYGRRPPCPRWLWNHPATTDGKMLAPPLAPTYMRTCKLLPTEQHDAQICEALRRELLQHVVACFGVFHGSIPSEALQNVIKRDQPLLYDLVVVRLYRRRWHSFVLACGEALCLFSVPSNRKPDREKTWRVRLTLYSNWEDADARIDRVMQCENASLLGYIRQALRRAPLHRLAGPPFSEKEKYGSPAVSWN